MSAVQGATSQGQREDRDACSRPRSRQCRLLREPYPLIAYVAGVAACYLACVAVAAVLTPVTSGDLTLFAALMGCGALCVEATRRLGQPTGVWRDLLSAWWLPVALLLPPLYALAAPAVLGLLTYLRVHLFLRAHRGSEHSGSILSGAVYRRMFSVAALGLAGAFASVLFRLCDTVVQQGPRSVLLSYPGPNAWLLHPSQAGAAAGCAIAFAVLNTCLIAVAAWLVAPGTRLSDMLWDRERMLLDLTETCVGILVTVSCGLSALLLVVALPPVILLQRSLLHSQLKAQARTDPKTGVLNCGAWQGEADLAVDRARRRRESLAVLLTDVDHFKNVNDTHGHLTGDVVLRTLAAEMRQQVRESDLVGRFGGEEFSILLSGTTADEACRVAERIRRGAAVLRVPPVGPVVPRDAATPRGPLVGVTVSVGVAVLGKHGDDLSELLDAADKALYRAKRAGRDRVCLAEPADVR
jgi:diguanylate cyclase (GGDEF)-like protein